MEFRKTKSLDVDKVLKIYEDSSKSLKDDGVDQWQRDRPDEKSIFKDMEMESSYVLIDENIVFGTVAIIFDGERNYDLIFNGNWINEEEYCTIHRFGVEVHSRKSGIASIMLEKIEEICLGNGIYDIRVDTHEDNFKMRNFLEKNEFLYCGKIFLESGDLRVAYQKEIKE